VGNLPAAAARDGDVRVGDDGEPDPRVGPRPRQAGELRPGSELVA
jgi:hypothetical protein